MASRDNRYRLAASSRNILGRSLSRRLQRIENVEFRLAVPLQRNNFNSACFTNEREIDLLSLFLLFFWSLLRARSALYYLGSSFRGSRLITIGERSRNCIVVRTKFRPWKKVRPDLRNSVAPSWFTFDCLSDSRITYTVSKSHFPPAIPRFLLSTVSRIVFRIYFNFIHESQLYISNYRYHEAQLCETRVGRKG